MRFIRVLLLTSAFVSVQFERFLRAGLLRRGMIRSVRSRLTRLSPPKSRQKIPGLAVGIYRRGQFLLADGYWQANVELGVA